MKLRFLNLHRGAELASIPRAQEFFLYQPINAEQLEIDQAIAGEVSIAADIAAILSICTGTARLWHSAGN